MQCPECQTALPDDSRFCASCGRPIPGAVGPAASAPKTSAAWIVLIVAVVLVGMVVVAGIVAAIAIPNLLNAVDRGKQKRTLADLRGIATAVESYAVDFDAYPVADSTADLAAALVPTYIKALPAQDGWGHTFRVSSDGESYQLASPGKDGVFETCERGQTTRFDDDICFADGHFVRYPEGLSGEG